MNYDHTMFMLDKKIIYLSINLLGHFACNTIIKLNVYICVHLTKVLMLLLLLFYFQMKYGGHGYSHILLTVLPKMLLKGITQAQIDKITTHNPQKWLTFK